MNVYAFLKIPDSGPVSQHNPPRNGSEQVQPSTATLSTLRTQLSQSELNVAMEGEEAEDEITFLSEVSSGCITLSDWRSSLYSTFSTGESSTIFVQRDDFATSLLGVYKGERLDLYKPPLIIFAGDSGKIGADDC